MQQIKCDFCDTYVDVTPLANGTFHCSIYLLTDYYGVNGFLCDACYAEIEHDDAGNPLHPARYTMLMLKNNVAPKDIFYMRKVDSNGNVLSEYNFHTQLASELNTLQIRIPVEVTNEKGS